jgi:phosphinothricin acetyltransferase
VATCDPIHEKAVSRPHAEGSKGEEKRADSFSPESECLVRYSTIGDLPAITAIYSRFVEASTATFEIVPPDQAEMSKRRLAVLNQALPYLVAELEGYVVGFCYASQFRPREGYRYTVEDSIYVRADCIGHGVGKALLSKLISECRARGCHSMIACICGVNVPSVALHASLGFQQAGLLPEAGRKFGEWLRLLILQRPLQSDSMQPAFEHK